MTGSNEMVTPEAGSGSESIELAQKIAHRLSPRP
jgi:hypothetical protein